MQTLRGYISRVGQGIATVRRADGGEINMLTKRPYRYGENIVMMYDPLRKIVVDSYTVSEWEAQQREIDLEDTGPGIEEEDDDEEEFFSMEDIDI